ncbi:MAG: hypothetical protein P4L22_00130 [Candidatus Babeliales bacterium]|nr:hypothetical protein [Candidatus Babeliales bacterium]
MSSIEKEKECHCSVDGFFITNRQTSMVCSLLILLFMMSFISGYFWGHGKATQEFTEKLVDDSFTDKINYAFSNFEKTSAEPEVESSEEDFEEVESDSQQIAAVKENEKIAQDKLSQASTESQAFAQPDLISDKFYYAELVGFGTMAAAQQFAQRALQHGYNVDIRQRVSKTAKGKSIYWFQAVTEKFDNKDQLMDLVAKIQKTEKIKDVKIVEEKKN